MLPAAIGPGVSSASNRNEYQKIFLGSSGVELKAENLAAICDPIV
jgi:hypothetical protein